MLCLTLIKVKFITLSIYPSICYLSLSYLMHFPFLFSYIYMSNQLLSFFFVLDKFLYSGSAFKNEFGYYHLLWQVQIFGYFNRYKSCRVCVILVLFFSQIILSIQKKTNYIFFKCTYFYRIEIAKYLFAFD